MFEKDMEELKTSIEDAEVKLKCKKKDLMEFEEGLSEVIEGVRFIDSSTSTANKSLKIKHGDTILKFELGSIEKIVNFIKRKYGKAFPVFNLKL